MELKKIIDLHIAHHKIILWIVAILVTLSSAVYQRLTGPTYPISGEVRIDDSNISFVLLRSENTTQNAEIKVKVEDPTIQGYVQYRRFKSNDDWTKIQFTRENNTLSAFLPKQPAAGKLIYIVFLVKDQEEFMLTEEPVIIRFKGPVPAHILLPHIFLMFIGMLYSNRSGIEALDSRGNAKKYMKLTIIFFFLGGLVLGPIVQKYAFDSFWTGIPFGNDLTDNKTLFAALGWVIAWYKNSGDKQGRGWILFASILMLAVYLIPHSLLGSELDYTTIPE
jgi:hypothetical protein